MVNITIYDIDYSQSILLYSTISCYNGSQIRKLTHMLHFPTLYADRVCVLL